MRKLAALWACAVVGASVGCVNLQDAKGNRVSLSRYDWVDMKSAEAGDESAISAKVAAAIGFQLRGCLRRSNKWLEREWEARSPAFLHISEVRASFPSKGSQLFMGASASASCRIAVHHPGDQESPLGTAIVATVLPSSRTNVISAGLVGVLLNAATLEDYDERADYYCYQLAQGLATEIGGVLCRAKDYSAPKEKAAAPP